MYCMQCGHELPDDAQFCTSCGAKTGRDASKAAKSPDGPEEDAAALNSPTADEPQDANEPLGSPTANEPREAGGPHEADEQHGGIPAELKQAVESTKQRSRRRVPLVVLIALAIALASGTAYAAYRVYVDIIVPIIQPPAVEVQQPAEDTASSSTEDNSAQEQESTPEIVQATGNPQSILQIAEILAMSPADIPPYLESQGLTGQQSTLPYSSYLWLSGSDNPYASADPTESLVGGANPATGAPWAQVTVGENLTPILHGFLDTAQYDTAALADGTKANSLVINGVPFKYFGSGLDGLATANPSRASDETIDAFVSLCGLGEVMGDASHANSSANAGETSSAFTIRVVTGIVEVGDQQMLWYLIMTSQTLGSTLGCLPMDVMWDQMDRNVGLYSQDEWDAASDSEKCQMAAMSILQDHFSGNGGMRTNLLTGEREIIDIDPNDPNREIWSEPDIAQDPKTGEDIYVSPVTGESWGPVANYGKQ